MHRFNHFPCRDDFHFCPYRIAGFDDADSRKSGSGFDSALCDVFMYRNGAWKSGFVCDGVDLFVLLFNGNFGVDVGGGDLSLLASGCCFCG